MESMEAPVLEPSVVRSVKACPADSMDMKIGQPRLGDKDAPIKLIPEKSRAMYKKRVTLRTLLERRDVVSSHQERRLEHSRDQGHHLPSSSQPHTLHVQHAVKNVNNNNNKSSQNILETAASTSTHILLPIGGADASTQQFAHLLLPLGKITAEGTVMFPTKTVPAPGVAAVAGKTAQVVSPSGSALALPPGMLGGTVAALPNTAVLQSGNPTWLQATPTDTFQNVLSQIQLETGLTPGHVPGTTHTSTIAVPANDGRFVLTQLGMDNKSEPSCSVNACVPNVRSDNAPCSGESNTSNYRITGSSITSLNTTVPAFAKNELASQSPSDKPAPSPAKSRKRPAPYCNELSSEYMQKNVSNIVVKNSMKNQFDFLDEIHIVNNSTIKGPVLYAFEIEGERFAPAVLLPQAEGDVGLVTCDIGRKRPPKVRVKETVANDLNFICVQSGGCKQVVVPVYVSDQSVEPLPAETFQGETASNSKPSAETEEGQTGDGEGKTQSHARVVPRDHRFGCYLCDYTEKEEALIIAHWVGVHLPEKPYHCKYCSKPFSTSRLAYNHVRQDHPSHEVAIFIDKSKLFARRVLLSLDQNEQLAHFVEELDSQEPEVPDPLVGDLTEIAAFIECTKKKKVPTATLR